MGSLFRHHCFVRVKHSEPESGLTGVFFPPSALHHYGTEASKDLSRKMSEGGYEVEGECKSHGHQYHCTGHQAKAGNLGLELRISWLTERLRMHHEWWQKQSPKVWMPPRPEPPADACESSPVPGWSQLCV